MRRCAIAFETLADYQEGRLDESAAAQLRQHLATDCTECRENLAWLERATETLRQAHAIQVPASAMTRARALFRERFQPIPTQNSVLAWLARLQFDSRNATPALVGARGAGREGVQLVFTTEKHDIDLFQEPADSGTWYLIGQVLPHEGDEAIVPRQVVLTERGGKRFTFTPDSEEFHLPSVPEGLYDIAVHLTEGEITLPGVEVGP